MIAKVSYLPPFVPFLHQFAGSDCMSDGPRTESYELCTQSWSDCVLFADFRIWTPFCRSSMDGVEI